MSAEIDQERVDGPYADEEELGAFSASSGSSTGEGTSATPPQTSKRKRSETNTPTTANDEAEIARRRRRRQSLAFQQRRKSLTPSTKAKSSSDTPPNRQYISDMYSTIIKMSSENKINVKNSWSLHLIDHMEDILESSPQEADPDDTYNFQKASCTLDASIKIYSYRVDDTWNSSYKILENLSRTDEKHGVEETSEETTTVRKTRKPQGAAAKTIEKNLNNINLKSYDMEFEADPMFHKMSQSFDEGGAKGMLLANLSVYDGCKILLNSSDVSVATRTSLSEVPEEPSLTEDGDEESKSSHKRISLSAFGNLSCLTQDVQSLSVCPQLSRLYDQLEELYEDDHPRHKIGLKTDFFLKTPVKGRKKPVEEEPENSVAMNLADAMEAAGADDNQDENEYDGVDVAMDYYDEDNDDTVDEGDQDMGEDAGADRSELNDTINTHAGDSVDDIPIKEENDMNIENDDPVIPPPESSLTMSAADFFRVRAEENPQQQDEAKMFLMMLESALLRSANASNDGDVDGKDDYSYFDVKMLRNWAGPAHWKFPAVRKVQTKHPKKEAHSSDTTAADNGEKGDEEEVAGTKATTATTREKRNVIIDFFAADEPDLKTLLRPARLPSSLVMSKLIVNRQTQKASDLVFPVDSHVEIGLFYQHFMKPRLRFFKKQQEGAGIQRTVSSTAEMNHVDDDASYGGNADQSFVSDYHDDVGGFDGGYDDDDGNDTADDTGESLYSTQDLVMAERVVEKIDVHYERFAKRVDVKKLKSSIWSHLECETPLLEEKNSSAEEPEAENSIDKSPVEKGKGKRQLSSLSTDAVDGITTFESVVNNVSDKVPSNVTVSFYFICMLHLANEKGLKLVGQDDLADFQIHKD